MDRVFRSFRGRVSEFPTVNVWANRDEAVVTAELPGLAPEDIELTVTGNTLTLQGERKSPELGKGEVYQRQERTFGRFVRSVRLPFPVEADEVAAVSNNGILKVTLPRHEATKPRQIAVKVQK
jgi:HSP20 family protein